MILMICEQEGACQRKNLHTPDAIGVARTFNRKVLCLNHPQQRMIHHFGCLKLPVLMAW